MEEKEITHTLSLHNLATRLIPEKLRCLTVQHLCMCSYFHFIKLFLLLLPLNVDDNSPLLPWSIKQMGKFSSILWKHSVSLESVAIIELGEDKTNQLIPILKLPAQFKIIPLVYSCLLHTTLTLPGFKESICLFLCTLCAGELQFGILREIIVFHLLKENYAWHP